MSEDADKGAAVPSVYQRLAARFPAEDHKTRKQGGRDLTYLPGEKVIGRLNDVLRFDWSFRVVNQGNTEVEAWVLGELAATIDGAVVTRQQYGNQDLARGQHPTSDLYKSAATDALKKCATTIGVGLYLYDEDERREVEQEMREAKRPRPAQPSGKVDAAAKLTGADPTPLKTKAELAADLKKGLEYARSLDLDVEDVDPAPLNRAEIEETIDTLRQHCRNALAERKKQAAS
jgi:recombination DNA repair RAD52 pathway protein